MPHRNLIAVLAMEQQVSRDQITDRFGVFGSHDAPVNAVTRSSSTMRDPAIHREQARGLDTSHFFVTDTF